MRVEGLAGLSLDKVYARLKATGVRPGSDRELAPMLREWKQQQREIARVPEAMMALADKLAEDIWYIAVATQREVAAQQGGLPEEPRPTRKRPPKAPAPRGQPRIRLLQKAVEKILRPDAKGDQLVRQPLGARPLYARLTAHQKALSSSAHFNRHMASICKISTLIVRSPDGKYWRRDRDLPEEYGGTKAERRYKRLASPLSETRTDNESVMEEVIAFLFAAGGEFTGQEILDRLGRGDDDVNKFKLMLRNHLRVKAPRIARGANGKWSAVKGGGKPRSRR